MKCSNCGAENEEGYRFCGTCGTPLFVPELAEDQVPEPLAQPSIESGVSGSTRLLKLNCPSCGGSLELPSNLTVAHCIYCGTKVLLDQVGVAHERRDLQRYIELCKVAVEAKNHKEAIEYCNRILEIDPKNVEAWIDKAISTFWLTTGAHNRFDEALEYLTKASQIAPDDGKIAKARDTLTEEQATWYNYLGNQQWEMAQKMYDIHYESYRRIYFNPGRCAKEDSVEYAIKAMDNYMIASDYAPDNIVILKNISAVAKFYDYANWGENVNAKIRRLELLRAKMNASGRLRKLKGELQEAKSELAKLQTQSGFFVGIKINDVQSRIVRLQSDIAKLEKDAAYTP